MPSLLLLGAGTDATAVGGWVPSTPGNLIGWWDADHVTGSAPVTAWTDRSGGGNNLSATNAGSLVTTFNGSKNAVSFDGVANQYECASFPMGTANGSAYAYVQSDSTGANNGRICSYSASGLTHDYDNAGSAAFLMYGTTGPVVSAFRTSVALSSKTVTANTPQRVCSVFDGANNTVYVQGVAGTPAACTDQFTTSGRFSIGAIANNGTSPWKGLVRAVFVYAKALSSTDVANLETYVIANY